ncbi:MAG: DUF1800 domain-containing protein [Flavitalea sp.]
MSGTNLQKNLHLLWRAGFGPSLSELGTLEQSSQKNLVNKLFRNSENTPARPDLANDEVKRMYNNASEQLSVMNNRNVARGNQTATDDEQQRDMDRRKIARQSRENIKDLNLFWLDQMTKNNDQLREKISLFWHGHFAANSGNILHQELLLDAIRKNALGNFKDLLRAVSKSGSMLNYLNNNQNRKNRPNENFAREVMELFTMGRGNYTEKDIKEAARAFTGWGTKPNGEFVFRKQQHDDRPKTFLGETGNFDGDDILDILLKQKQTAKYITEKIYRFYVNDFTDHKRVDQLASQFYQSGYNIKSFLQNIFESDWFYDEKNIGNRIKSPVELIIGIRRTLDLQIENQTVQLLLQRLLGQLLFYPPNVAGWPGGLAWIDSSSLMLRLQIPGMIIDSGELKLAPKDDDDQMMGMKDSRIQQIRTKNKKGKVGQTINAFVNWQPYVSGFEKIKRDLLLSRITARIIIPAVGERTLVSDQFIDSSDRVSFIKTSTIQLMSTPEYQLC